MGFAARVDEGVCVGWNMKVIYLNKGVSHPQTGEPWNAALEANFLVSRDWPWIYYAFWENKSEERWYQQEKYFAKNEGKKEGDESAGNEREWV